jgi:hypothetical protein
LKPAPAFPIASRIAADIPSHKATWQKCQRGAPPKLQNFGLRRIDDALFQIGQKMLLAVVAVRLQEPRKFVEEVKHARLLLRNENERLYRDRW